MKKFYLIVASFFISYIGLAQSDLQEYGEIGMSDLTMKECAFEKNADAMVLFEKGELWIGLSVRLKAHKRLKIFNEKGKGQGHIRLSYYAGDNKYQNISEISAQTISLNNKGEKVIRKLSSRYISRERSADKEWVVVISFPNVRAGDVIEYKYTLNSHIGHIPSWSFQSEIPTRYSYLSQEVVDWLDFSSTIEGSFPMSLDKAEELPNPFDFRRTPYEFYPIAERRDFAINTEPYMDLIRNNLYPYSQSMLTKRELAVKDIPAIKLEPSVNKIDLQKISFQLKAIKSRFGAWLPVEWQWNLLASELLASPKYGLQLTKNLRDSKEFLHQVKAMDSNREKVTAIYNYVKENMQWNGIDTRGATQNIVKAWKERTGTSGEINLILLNLLKEAGINSKPLLVRTGGYGEINKSYSTIHQFNKTVVYVLLESESQVLDASAKNASTSLIANTDGFIVQKGEAEWIKLENIRPFK